MKIQLIPARENQVQTFDIWWFMYSFFQSHVNVWLVVEVLLSQVEVSRIRWVRFQQVLKQSAAILPFCTALSTFKNLEKSL